MVSVNDIDFQQDLFAGDKADGEICHPQHGWVQKSYSILTKITQIQNQISLTVWIFNFSEPLYPFCSVREGAGYAKLYMAEGRVSYQPNPGPYLGVWHLAQGYHGSTLKVSLDLPLLPEHLSWFVHTGGPYHNCS